MRRFFFTATPRETRALSMFVGPSSEDGDSRSENGSDSENGLDSEDGENENIVERSRRLLGGLIYEYGFADAMTDGVITDYSLGFAAYV